MDENNRRNQTLGGAKLGGLAVILLIFVIRAISTSGFPAGFDRGADDYFAPSALWFAIPILMIVAVAAFLLVRLFGRRGRGSPHRNAEHNPRHGNCDMMENDHYKRTKREYRNLGADPCAYSEGYSWRKGEQYDDPWNL